MVSDQFISLDDALNLNRDQTREMYRLYVNPGLADMLSEMDLDKNFVQAEGALVLDDEGNEYLDFTAGNGALNLGHNPPEVLDAFLKVKRVPVVPQASLSKLTAALAHNLAQIAPGDLNHCFFCSANSEAVQAALKLARIATARRRLVYCDGATHGLTMDALSVNEGDNYKDNQKIPYDDTAALETALEDGQAACFIVEPILVDGGIIFPGKGYLQKVREICTRYGTLLIVDECQTGLGRCGSLFLCSAAEAIPDILCLPRSLGGGLVPVGGFITTSEIRQKAYDGSDECLLHRSSFGGSTLAMAAAITVLNETIGQELSRQAREKGDYLLQKLNALANESNYVKEVRGEGLLIGLELEDEFPDLIVEDLINRHRIISCRTQNNPDVLRVTPPLTVTYEQLDSFVEALSSTLMEKLGADLTATVETAIPSVLVVAHDDSLPPWVFLHEESSMGISVEVFQELARQMNTIIKFLGATWTNIFPLLINKQIDLILNAGWPNAYFDDFPVIASNPYARFEYHLFMKRDPSESMVNFSLDDIEGKKIGVLRASLVASLLKKTGAEVFEYDNDTLNFLDHFWNKTDFVAAEKMVGLSLNQTFFQGCFQIVSEPINVHEVVCLAHKDNALLIKKINTEIDSLKKSQAIEPIYHKYYDYNSPRKLEAKTRAVKNP